MEFYSDAIDAISQAVRDTEAWPDDTSKLQEQIDLLFVATLVVASEIPLSRLTLTESAALSSTALQGTTKRYDLPSDLFQLREDNGIHNFDFDGAIRFPFESLPYPSVKRAGGNTIVDGQQVFALDLAGNALYANSVTEAKVNYAQALTKPTTANYNATDYPLNDKDAQRAVHLVAYHVSGVTIRDSAAAQFQALLANEYTG